MKKINEVIINDIVKTIDADSAELGLTKATGLKEKVGILLDAVQKYQEIQIKTIDGYNFKRNWLLNIWNPLIKKCF